MTVFMWTAVLLAFLRFVLHSLRPRPRRAPKNGEPAPSKKPKSYQFPLLATLYKGKLSQPPKTWTISMTQAVMPFQNPQSKPCHHTVFSTLEFASRRWPYAIATATGRLMATYAFHVKRNATLVKDV
jgi:hypothetical protein